MALYRLSCQVQNYAWGRSAEDSEVAKLSQAAGQSVDPSLPFAELWMGTHPSCPSALADNGLAGTCLKQLLQQCPELLGAALLEFGADLPFLFKVLSVGTALSIQSHPDKKLAEQLHKDKPEIYKDDNYKPEMALALTDFEALCEFVDQAELAHAFETVPELRECTGDAVADDVVSGNTDQDAAKDAAESLRAAFSKLMVCPPEVVGRAVERMAARLQAEVAQRQLTPKEQLVLRLNQQYPGDVGVLAAWFLNYVRLQPGQAICLQPNEPHAYVSGEIIECMATSDNVIRAGLTPKCRDTEVLCRSLTYSQGQPEVLVGDKVLPYLQLYRPPFKEFEIYSFQPPAGAAAELPPCRGPALLLVQHGSSKLRASLEEGKVASRGTQRGDVWFVGAGTGLEFDVQEDLVVWVAACNGLGFAPAASSSNILPFARKRGDAVAGATAAAGGDS